MRICRDLCKCMYNYIHVDTEHVYIYIYIYAHMPIVCLPKTYYIKYIDIYFLAKLLHTHLHASSYNCGRT